MNNPRPKAHPAREAQIKNRLGQTHRRLTDIASIERNASLVGGYGSKGEFDPERQRLIEETDRLLDELAAVGGTLPFEPRGNTRIPP